MPKMWIVQGIQAVTTIVSNGVVFLDDINGIILGMGSANERRCYNVRSSLTGWAHTQNDPYIKGI